MGSLTPTLSGFGIPHLRTLCQLRFMESLCWALNSRNTLVAQTLRWFVDHPATLPVRNNDIAALRDIQQAFRLRLVTATNGVSAKVRITHRRGYTHGRVVLVSDGSDTDHVISWGAVVAIEEDGVVATACSDVRVHVGWSWCRVGGPCGTGICTAGGSNPPGGGLYASSS